MTTNHFRLSQNKLLITLTGALVLIVAFAIAATGWASNLNAVVFIGGFSIIIGLLASRSRLPGFIAHLFSLIIGAGWSFWVVSQMLPESYSWSMRWQNMWERIGNWYNLALKGGVSYDNVIFVLEMGLIVWGIGYLTLWFMFRGGKLWSAILPGGVVLLINLYYAPKDLTFWFLAYLLVSMLLIVRFNLMEHQKRWRSNHTFFRTDISFDFLRDGLIFSVLIIALAWLTPSVSEAYAVDTFTPFDKSWHFLQNEWNRLFANLNYRPDARLSANAFGQALNLGGPRRLTPRPVMMVQAPGGRYWRASVYDEYTGQGWQSHDQVNLDMPPNKLISTLPFYRARRPFTQTYTLFNDGVSVLHGMNSARSVSRSAVAKTNHVSMEQASGGAHPYWAGKREPWLEELTYLQSYRRMKEGDSYQVVSLISVATREDLQGDTASCPNWITERYLQLPEGIPRRVFDLAEEITQNKDNDFDKAAAIEDYLRVNISYNEAIPPPPPGRDKVDYILFDSKEAYCDYYATAMIVMLRHLGVPARLAAGYAQGQPDTLDDNTQIYNVQNKDAHSWVEVFFPSYGWIEFEPTAAQAVIIRRTEQNDEFIPAADRLDTGPDGEFDPLDRLEDADLNAEGDLPAKSPAFQITLPGLGRISVSWRGAVGAAVVILLVLAAFGGWAFYARRWQLQGKDLPVVSAVYFSLLKLAAWMGLQRRPGQTPYEHASQLEAAVPDAQAEIQTIAQEFVRQQYSRNYSASSRIKLQLTNAWNALRPRLYRAIVERRNPFRKTTADR